MKITFDGRSLLSPWTGIQTYLIELINELNEDSENLELFLYPGSSFKISKEAKSTLQALPISKLYFKPLGKTVLDIIINKSGTRGLFKSNKLKIKTDIFHETDILEIPCDNKSILTVHDTIPMIFPEAFPTNTYESFAKIISNNCKLSEHIVVDSESTKNGLSFFFNVPDHKISVVYAGVADHFKPIEDKQVLESINKKYNLPDKFLLYLGTIEPRKNVARILEAYNKISNDIGELKLVICGSYGWGAHEVYKTLDRLKLKDKVLFTGYVDEIDKPALYSAAQAFVFPSLYEGFGLPPLESMACGTPVVTSDISSLPEIVDDAGIKVDPLDINQIAEGILSIIKDRELAEKLRFKGLERSKQFTWKNTAKQMVEVYKKVIK